MGCGSSRATPVAMGPYADAESEAANAQQAEVKAAAATPPKTPATTAAPKKLSVTGAKNAAKAGDTAVAVALRAKRKGVMVEGTSVQVGNAYVKKVVPKDDSVREYISSALRDNVLFAALGAAALRDMIDAMEPRTVPAGSIIIRQGEAGDNFYVIESGKLEILIEMKKVADWGEGTKNRTVGELALLYNAPRAASVRAVTDAKLWAIDRTTFRNVIAQASYQQHQKLKAALRRGLLEDLSEEQLDKIAAAATIVKYSKGDQIIRKGEEGEVFYIIESGAVICKNLPGEQSNNVLSAGDYFGERALLKREPRVCDVFADSDDVSLIALYREDFENLLGHLRELLEHNLGMRLLLCVPMLASLSDEDRATLFSRLRLITYKDGQTLMAVGTAVTQFFIIREGAVAVTTNQKGTLKNFQLDGKLVAPKPESEGEDGVQRELGTLTAGQWFGENEVSQTVPSPVSYVARGAVQCFVLDRTTYTDILEPLAAQMKDSKSPAPKAAGAGSSAAPAASAVTSPTASGSANRTAAAATTPSAAGGAGKGAAATPEQHLVVRSPEQAPRAPAPRQRLGIPLKELEQRATLGTGTFGRVKLVYHKKTNRVFALKMLQKAQIVALKQQQNIMNEKEILWRVDHPFIIKLYDTYKDKDRLYMLIELVQGGELFSRLQNSATPGRISPAEARFYAGCVLDAFEHLHSLNIVYRDLKPENLLIDSEGYLKVVDFGFAKIVKDRTYTLCGTPEYLAPELVLGKGHDKGVDYWALGILLYEQVAGYSPFADHANNDQMVICRNILKGEVEFPAHFKDKDLRDVILKLLVKDVSRRLGGLRGGAQDIKQHRFFRPLEFDRLTAKKLEAPWRPTLKDPLDTSNFDPYDEDDDAEPYRDDGSNWEKNF